MLFTGESKTVNDFFDLVFGVFDPLGNLDFLFAREQGHLAHLLEIHPNRVVQNVQPALVLFLLRLRLFDVIHLRLVHDLHLEVAKLDIDLIQLLRRDHRVRQRVVDVVVGQVPLLLREPNEFPDLFGQIYSRLVFDGADCLLRSADWGGDSLKIG